MSFIIWRDSGVRAIAILIAKALCYQKSQLTPAKSLSSPSPLLTPIPIPILILEPGPLSF